MLGVLVRACTSVLFFPTPSQYLESLSVRLQITIPLLTATLGSFCLFSGFFQRLTLNDGKKMSCMRGKETRGPSYVRVSPSRLHLPSKTRLEGGPFSPRVFVSS